jgi:alpha-amylase/alpha-mannosidase (GH57 family)
MNGKLPVAIIWHMHQPYYRHPQTSEFVLPWVRLHASKDYLHMARLLQEFPKVKANFTMVPSLRDQLEDYARGADDEDTRVTMRTVDGDLTPEEKQHMLRRFFSIHHGNVIHRHEEYRRLLQIALAAQDRAELLSDDYFVDLAVWFNLAWLDPDDVASDGRLLELRESGRRFTREDVRYVIGRQRLMASGVPHLYHRLEHDGQIELMTVPYYHPILPLIIDERSALRSDPSAVVNDPPFSYPDDAAFHLEEAIASHARSFGKKPRGTWPSEGAVSPEAAKAIFDAGLEWFASDEGVLAKTIGVELKRDDIGALLEPGLLYRPFRVDGGTAIFRDRELSDRIGFMYGDMKPHDAVGDMIWKLERARDRLPDEGGPYLAAIILDGENAWEQYPNNGNDFLRYLYGTLQQDERFETVRVSEFLDRNKATVDLGHPLATGSWIDANLRVWAGEPAHARAWSALERTRRFANEQWGPLRNMPKSVRQPLMVAEGSDWFWWYSSRNSSPEDSVFDALFRANLEVVWWYAGAEPPDDIRQPLIDPDRAAAVAGRGGAMLPGQREQYG